MADDPEVQQLIEALIAAAVKSVEIPATIPFLTRADLVREETKRITPEAVAMLRTGHTRTAKKDKTAQENEHLKAAIQQACEVYGPDASLKSIHGFVDADARARGTKPPGDTKLKKLLKAIREEDREKWSRLQKRPILFP